LEVREGKLEGVEQAHDDAITQTRTVGEPDGKPVQVREGEPSKQLRGLGGY